MTDPTTPAKRADPRLPRADETLVIHEIYASIQGESTWAGLPCTFVRTTACNLRCRWCDTTTAFTGGERMPVSDVVRDALATGTPMVEVTGGEPLLQAGTLTLLLTDDPGFVEACAGRLEEATGERRGAWPADLPVVFTAHSVPVLMAQASPYEAEIRASCQGVAERLGLVGS